MLFIDSKKEKEKEKKKGKKNFNRSAEQYKLQIKRETRESNEGKKKRDWKKKELSSSHRVKRVLHLGPRPYFKNGKCNLNVSRK